MLTLSVFCPSDAYTCSIFVCGRVGEASACSYPDAHHANSDDNTAPTLRLRRLRTFSVLRIYLLLLVHWIFPILDEASSLPSGWNFASSTTALKLFTIQW